MHSNIDSLYKKDVIYCGNGIVMEVDLLSASVILEMRAENEYKNPKLICALLCTNQTERWVNKNDIRLYNEIIKKPIK